MIATVRKTLATLGGPQALLALLAIGWGLGKLQQLAEERQALIDAQAQAIAEQQAALVDLAKQRHPAGTGLHTYEECTTRSHPECYPADYVAEKHAREDVDPLGRGEPA